MPKVVRPKDTSRTTAKIEKRIVQYYEFSKQLRSLERHFRRAENISEVEDMYSSIEEIYNDYFGSSSSKTNYKFEQMIKEGVNQLSDKLALSFAQDSIKFYEYARNIANLRKIQPYQNSIEYFLLRSILLARSIQSSVFVADYNWHKEIINEIEIINEPFVGFSLEAIIVHVLLAYQRGITELAYSAHEFGKAIKNIGVVENLVPSICIGELINRQLREIGNTSEVYNPDEILNLAERALSMFIDEIQEVEIKNYIDLGKAHIRWWIAEAYSRLASGDAAQADEYWKLAQPKLNWIIRQSKSSDEVNIYMPKVRQVQGHFYAIQKNFTQAISSLEEALNEFRSKQDWFECIQTLLILISINQQRLQEKAHSNKKITQEEMILYQNQIGELESLFHRQRQEVSKGSYAVVYLLLIRTACFLAAHLKRFAQFAEDKIALYSKINDYWTFAIDGYKKFGLYGRAAIEASEMKTSGLDLPKNFESLCFELFYRWDPRYEKTDRFNVEQALKLLTGDEVTTGRLDETATTKKQAILDVQRLLSRDHADYNQCLTILSHEVDNIDDNDPKDEDIRLLQWLWKCYAHKGDLKQGEKIRSREERLKGILSCKNCLELALSFENHPPIYERFLTLAASVVVVGANPCAEKAARLLDKMYGKITPVSEGAIRTEGEHLTFDRLMNIPLDQFDQETSYSLTFVLETEMRRLISQLLGEQDQDWWKNKIPPDVRGYAEGGYKKEVTTRGDASGYTYLEYVNLSDLFKIIVQRENWRECFEVVFKSKEYVNSKANILLNKRNDIMHSRQLRDDDLYEFVTVTRNFIRVMEPFLPK